MQHAFPRLDKILSTNLKEKKKKTTAAPFALGIQKKKKNVIYSQGLEAC